MSITFSWPENAEGFRVCYARTKKQQCEFARSRTSTGQTIDLNWDKIHGMREPKAYELRIDDVIGGHNNLRVIFWMPPKDIVLPGDVLPRLWIVSVLQKKEQRFSNNDLRIFRGKVIIVKRPYSDYL